MGKTCLLTRFAHDSFDEHMPSTVGKKRWLWCCSVGSLGCLPARSQPLSASLRLSDDAPSTASGVDFAVKRMAVYDKRVKLTVGVGLAL